MPKRVNLLLIYIVFLCGFVFAQSSAPSWIAVSNGYTNKLLTVEMKHHPE